VIHDLARLINPNGRLGIAGVFLPNDAKPIDEIEKRGDLLVPWQTLFKNSTTQYSTFAHMASRAD
jgi:hypothetical protein